MRTKLKALLEAAKEGNIDRAALRWMDTTMSCIECHRYVRNELVVDPPEAGRLRLHQEVALRSRVEVGTNLFPGSQLSMRQLRLDCPDKETHHVSCADCQ